MNGFEIACQNIKDTNTCAGIVSGLVQPGDVILLEGTLGAGKTQFVKAFCAALGYEKNVSSPSYTLSNIYALGTSTIIHADFYRIKNEFELLDMGLDYHLDNSIALIEWGERFPDFFSNYLKIKIEHVSDCPDCRKISFAFHGNAWVDKFKNIEKHLSVQ